MIITPSPYPLSEEWIGEIPLGNFWWAQVDSNHRPRAYQARALTTWAMSPCKFSSVYLVHLAHHWWRWRESNPWPPACRAGALPAELHPHNNEVIGKSEEWIGMRSLLSISFELPFGHSKLNNNERLFKPLLCLYFLSPSFFWFWSISEYDTTATLSPCIVFSIERRWSSRTFRYGYLVTT